jgi:hypothetical protein
MVNDDNTLQNRVNTILAGTGQPSAEEATGALKLARAPDVAAGPFSEFVDEHLDGATALASRLMSIADNESLQAALDEVDRAFATEMPGLVQYALMLFMTHHPGARSKLKLLSLEDRQPGLVLPSNRSDVKLSIDKALAPGVAEEALPLTGSTPPENRLDFWREDPLLNDHHEHWHLVYPMRGRPGPEPRKLGDRHGELFAYMHEQMLARYDAERLSVGLSRVDRFADYAAPIPQGYDPGALKLWDGSAWSKFRARPTGAKLSDLTGPFATRPGAKLADQQAFYGKLRSATERGSFVVNGASTPVTIDNLGNTEEANIGTVDAKDSYGNHHNDGHIHFMAYDNQKPYGVMGSTATAVRDPIFFRWHKEVDSVFQSHQSRLPPHDFSAGPRARIRKNAAIGASVDMILARKDGMPAGFDGSPAAGAALGAEAFGPAVWDKDFSATTVTLSGGRRLTTTGELLTEVRKRKIKLDGREVTIDYLSHDDFYYFLRLENLDAAPQRVTVRIFLAPETTLEDRTAWIEMDRFSQSLAGAARVVVYRPAHLSSVIRKPARRAEDLEADRPLPPANQESWCDCGWPYTLLVPQGTPSGMAYRLFVMLSPGDDLDEPSDPSRCTSLSYCGLKDKKYPDKRAMGYPFDRPFKEPISAVVAKHDTMASRKIAIRLEKR